MREGREFPPVADRPRHLNKKGAVFTEPFFIPSGGTCLGSMPYFVYLITKKKRTVRTVIQTAPRGKGKGPEV